MTITGPVTVPRDAPECPARLPRLARTLVHVRPGQAAHWTRLRAQRTLLRSGSSAAASWLTSGQARSVASGWPPGFRPIDARLADHWPSADELRAGKIRLLGVARDLGEPADWRQADQPLLWRFHLHYWDWAWGLAAAQDRLLARAVFARLWRSWRASADPGCDAWLPYPAGLRAWSWCGQHASLVAGSDLEPAFIAELARHAGFMRRHLERDVGGNHLVKGLKAVVGLGVFFADERLVRLALRRLVGQLAVQVLPDGGHYERAPAYHCQVLADLVDVAGLLRAAGYQAPAELAEAIGRMRSWLGAVLGPDGRVPLRGDGYPVAPGLIAALRPATPPGDGALLMLPDTGLARLSAHGWHLLAYLGDPGEPALAAHAHADTLSFLAWLDGQPVLADTGTSTYQAGPHRDYERSTGAHNTAVIDGADSTEVWGGFRAGRRARVHSVTASARRTMLTCAASHDGYRWLPGGPVHSRRWSLSGDGLRVDDVFTGAGRHEVVIRWHLEPGSQLRLTQPGAVVQTPAGWLRVAMKSSRPGTMAAGTGQAATGLGATTDIPVLTWRADAALPLRVTTTWRRVPGGATGVIA